MTAGTLVLCPACGAPGEPGDQFCERCGARRPDAPAVAGGCRSCGAPPEAIGDDGYCTVCGIARRAEGDRVEVDLGVVAAVSDRGLVHRRNEDAFDVRLAGERTVTLVVCDGISSASAADQAARLAARSAGAALALSEAADKPDLEALLAVAIEHAGGAVAAVRWTSRAGRAVPSCTLVAAVVRGVEVAVGWVGDSRAYWIAGGAVRQLTTDDSWAQEQVAEGRLSPRQAAADARSHSITNWLGPDAPARPPQVVSLRAEQPGRLLLCSDGLWNYAPEPADLAALLAAVPEPAAPFAVTRSLTDFALGCGGRDNITVAVADIDPLDPPSLQEP